MKLAPVRFIGNRSSGRMGMAVAAEATRRGAAVTLVVGPVTDEIRVGKLAEFAARRAVQEQGRGRAAGRRGERVEVELGTRDRLDRGQRLQRRDMADQFFFEQERDLRLDARMEGRLFPSINRRRIFLAIRLCLY